MNLSHYQRLLLLLVGVAMLNLLAACNREPAPQLVELATPVATLEAIPTTTRAAEPAAGPADANEESTSGEQAEADEAEADEAEADEAEADEAEADSAATTDDANESSDDESVDTPVEILFTEPADGAVVTPTFGIKMAATGISVDPAGEVVEGSGHMHILVDTDFIAAGEVIPADDQHVHFGKAQLETELTLTPGEHVLRLQIADGAHIAFEGDQYRHEITVTVVDEASEDEATEDAPEEVSIAFSEPADGAIVTPTFGIKMAATGISVDPAGEVVEGSGHMHILVDTDFIAAGEVIPADEQHIHFGKAQLETELTLTPGEHVLRLQIADGAHIAFEGDQYRHEITVTVVDEANNEGDSAEADSAEADGAEADGDEAEDSEGSESAPSEGTAAPRPPEELWTAMTCNACHNINEDQTEENRGPVGPHQNNLYERAGERVEGMTAEEYIYNSIVNPNDYIVETYFENVMLQDYAEKMTEEEIRSIVDWMLDPERTPPDLP